MQQCKFHTTAHHVARPELSSAVYNLSKLNIICAFCSLQSLRRIWTVCAHVPALHVQGDGSNSYHSLKVAPNVIMS